MPLTVAFRVNDPDVHNELIVDENTPVLGFILTGDGCPDNDHVTGVEPEDIVAVVVKELDVSQSAIDSVFMTGFIAEFNVNVVLPEPTAFVAVTVIVTPLLRLDADTEITPVEESIDTPDPPDIVHVIVLIAVGLVTVAVGPVALLFVSIDWVPIEFTTGLTAAPRLNFCTPVIELTHVFAVAVKFRAVKFVDCGIATDSLTRPPDVSPVTFVTVIPRVERTEPSSALKVQSVTIDIGVVAAVIVIV